MKSVVLLLGVLVGRRRRRRRRREKQTDADDPSPFYQHERRAILVASLSPNRENILSS
jgi:hypothetical protein